MKWIKILKSHSIVQALVLGIIHSFSVSQSPLILSELSSPSAFPAERPISPQGITCIKPFLPVLLPPLWPDTEL